jgi:magnesium chelatase accessory protein
VFTTAPLRFERDGADWPNREYSRFIEAAGLRWHVQVCGTGPVVLLVHGTGASTHSWRDVLPHLARRFTVVAPDLPGHAFTAERGADSLSLQGMADGVAHLCRALALTPRYGIGHSAGAAVLARACLDGALSLRRLVSLNGALLPFPGAVGHVFGHLARTMAFTGVVPWCFARSAGRDPQVVTEMLARTGSRLDARGIALYRRLAGNVGHVRATLGMMGNWDLYALDAALPRLTIPVLLVTGSRDRTVTPATTQRTAAILPDARVHVLEGLGHLAHEEAPALVSDLLLETLSEAGAD